MPYILFAVFLLAVVAFVVWRRRRNRGDENAQLPPCCR
ncbi:hypothetical protein MBRU_14915 [Mycolicibacterium brumae DSM 44177]|nr:hypothetical protein MBRU_14915 [Mycolicibacterium brumae DSM 44177]